MTYIAEVGRAIDVLGTGTATYNVTLSGAVPVGDMLVLAVNTTAGSTGGQTGYTAADSKGNTWTYRALQNVYSTGNPSANGSVAVLTCQVTAALSSGDTVTLTSLSGAITKWIALIEQFRGVAGFAGSAGGQASSALPTASTTAAQAGQLVVGVAGWTDAAGAVTCTPTAPAGATSAAKASTYPINTTAPRGMQVWWAETTTSATRTASATLSSTQPWGDLVATLNLAATAGPHFIKVGSSWVPATRTIP